MTSKKKYFSGVHHKKKDCATSLVMNKEQNENKKSKIKKWKNEKS